MNGFAAIVGDEHVRGGTAADAVDGVMPAVVAWPQTEEEVGRLLAATRGVNVVAKGLGGHLDVGAPPRPIGLLVDLTRLNRVVEHSAADMTVVVQAGCPLSVLQTTLASAGQWLPVDPPRPGATSAGGLVAANLWGPLRSSQGGVRDLLIGVRVVGADGAVVRGGGRVVKNVAGYDLPKVHVGALGQLGILTELVFRVRPRPPVEDAVAIACASHTVAVETALALRGRVDPGWLMVQGGRDTEVRLLVGFLGVAEEVREARERVSALATGARQVAAPSALREEVADFPRDPAAMTLRVSVVPSDLVGVLTAIETLVPTTVAGVVAHVAMGVAKLAVAAGAAPIPLLERLRAVVGRLGGTVVVERAPATTKRGLDVFGDLGPAQGLMRRIKASLDPEDRLASGRLL